MSTLHFSLIFCAFKCNLCLLINNLIIAALFHSDSIIRHYYGVTTATTIMPVITRSQSRALTGSTLVLSELNSNLTGTIKELSHSTTTISTDVLSHSIDATVLNNTSTTLDPILSSSSSSLEFQTLIVDSKISNSSKIEISETTTSSIHPCHNVSVSNLSIMAEDCNDASIMSKTTKDMGDMNQLFNTLLTQITSQNQRLQDQIALNDERMSHDFQNVVQIHDDFKKEVRKELDELRSLLSRQCSTVPSSTRFGHSNVKNAS
jgi:hypothetical protein